MLRDRLTVVGHIHDITVPTIVIYGTADTVVPPAQSRIVAQRAGGLVRAVEVPGADHNDEILFTGAPVIDAVVELAERIVGPRTD
jgi:pimeloyl-ACP methyl ester carboxylesterase